MLLAILSIFTLDAQAVPRVSLAPQKECLIQRAEFVPAMDELARLNLPMHILSASPMIFVGSSKGVERCSAAIVSDQGHILTAGHCIDQCLRDNNAYTQSGGFHTVNTEVLSQVKCQIVVNNKKVDVKVLATNDCPTPEWTSAKAPKSCRGLDYAILELDPPILSQQPCFRTSRRHPGPGQTVMAVGFPKASNRKSNKASARDADGKSQFISTGKTISAQDTCEMSVDNKSVISSIFTGKETAGPKTLGDEQIKFALERVNSKGLIQTTADILQGSSGGPLINRYSGQLIGVASFFAGGRHGDTAECKGAAFFSSAATMVEEIESKFPAALPALNCDKNSFAR